MARLRVALCNQKGGVGKTSTTLNLADAGLRRGMRVLVIDLDPQHNATDPLLPDWTPGADDRTVNDVLAIVDEEVRVGSAGAAITRSPWEGPGQLDVMPATAALANREGERPDAWEWWLAEALDGVDDSYDLVLMDCPPSLGRLSVTALVAANSALLVTRPDTFSIRGLAQVVDTIGRVRKRHNPELVVAGVLINSLTDTREEEVRRSLEELREIFGEQLLDVRIPKAVIVGKAHRAAVPVSAYLKYEKRAGELVDLYDQLLDKIIAAPIPAGV